MIDVRTPFSLAASPALEWPREHAFIRVEHDVLLQHRLERVVSECSGGSFFV